MSHYKPLIILITATGTIIATNILGVKINTTPSMPKGLYCKKFSEPQRGDIVAVCLNSDWRALGLARHYLKPGTACENTQALIKKIIAVPGDRVLLMKNNLTVNDDVYTFATADHDHNGNNLFAYPRGIYAPTHAYWLIGTSSADSWDSRYWGPIPREQITENLQPILVYRRHFIFISTSYHISDEQQENKDGHDQWK